MKGTDIYYISGPKRVGAWGANYPDSLTADSVPNPDEWGPDEYWTAQTYIDWYKLNQTTYGNAVAKNKMLRAIELWSFAGAEYDYCYNREFNEFFTAQGIDVTTIFCSAVDAALNVAGDAGTVLTSATGTAASIASFLKAASPFLLVGAAIWAADAFVVPAAKRLKKNYSGSGNVSGKKYNSEKDIPYNKVLDYADKVGLNVDASEQNFKDARRELWDKKYAKHGKRR